MAYEVELTEVTAMPMAAVRASSTRETLGKTITSSFDIVYAFLRGNSILNLGLNVVVYLDSNLNLEVGVLVPEPFVSNGVVLNSATPAGLAAHVTYFGPYDKMGPAYTALEEWCQSQGRKMIGPSWEAYGHWNDDPAQLRTDIYSLVSER